MNDIYLLWTIFSIFVGISLAIDLGVFSKIFKRNTHKDVPPFKTALRWTIVWISLAGIFAGIIYVDMGHDKLAEFITGYALKNHFLLIHVCVSTYLYIMKIPYKFQHRVLSMGILGAIAMRVPLIIAGAHLLEEFHWMIYLFGAFLIFTALRMLSQRGEKKIEVEKNFAVRLLKKIIPVEINVENPKFFLIRDGIKYATPLLVALVIIEFTDLLFALDSIPAILAITTDPFIVITSNIFAILGLRSLYFLLAGVMEKFHYLKPGLIAILLFIGIKMLVSEIIDIPTMMSLGVVMGILGIAILMSFIRTRRNIE